jgi:hypothetical protein
MMFKCCAVNKKNLHRQRMQNGVRSKQAFEQGTVGWWNPDVKISGFHAEIEVECLHEEMNMR